MNQGAPSACTRHYGHKRERRCRKIKYKHQSGDPVKKLGQRVVILDADFGLANIEIMFGAVPQFNLSDLIYKGKDITEIITWGPGGIGFISGGSGIAGLSNLNRGISGLYYPQSGKAGFYSGRDHCGHGSGHFGCCTGISGGEQRGASGNDTGTDLHYRFVFSVKSTRASSAFFQ